MDGTVNITVETTTLAEARKAVVEEWRKLLGDPEADLPIEVEFDTSAVRGAKTVTTASIELGGISIPDVADSQ